MPAEIKPCPFCGSAITIDDISLDDRKNDDGSPMYDDWSATCLICPNMKCRASVGLDEEELPAIFSAAVIEKWNRRADTMEQNGPIAQQTNGRN